MYARAGRTRAAAMASPMARRRAVPRGEREVRSERTSGVSLGCTDEKVARNYTLMRPLPERCIILVSLGARRVSAGR